MSPPVGNHNDSLFSRLGLVYKCEISSQAISFVLIEHSSLIHLHSEIAMWYMGNSAAMLCLKACAIVSVFMQATLAYRYRDGESSHYENTPM